jgi:hypothetical protein
MNDLGCQPTAKKTLMNAVERLNATANRFDELSNLSERLVAKFERTEDMPCKTEIMGDKECENSQPDIIDLFNGINNRLDNLLNKIGNNVERVVNMID